MVVKNTSGKVIGFGQSVILPGQKAEVADSFEKNPVVDTYKALGFIEVVKSEAAVEKKNKTAGKKSAAVDDKTE